MEKEFTCSLDVLLHTLQFTNCYSLIKKNTEFVIARVNNFHADGTIILLIPLL